MKCPVCTSSATRRFLRRENVPVHQHVIFDDEASARAIERGDLDMAVCAECGFVFNAAFDETKLSYDEDYDNNQICSSVFNDYVDGLVTHLLDERGLRGKTIVEVGCGKGYFLRKLVERDERTRGIGFDPTYTGPLSDLDGRLTFERSFYGPGCEHVVPDAVVCRHVIEHVADPAAMVDSVRQALEHAPDARVFFETPCIEWILRGGVIWDLFYEHCSLFTAASLRTLFERRGFEVDEVRHVFGEQYLWLEARPAAAGGYRSIRSDGDVARLADAFAAEERRLVEMWQERLRTLREHGNVALWGAGAKGVSFADLVDRERVGVACVVDLNPRKQGHFLPGTAHPIVGYADLPRYDVRSAIVMNPNYMDENRRLLSDAGLEITLVDEET